MRRIAIIFISILLTVGAEPFVSRFIRQSLDRPAQDNDNQSVPWRKEFRLFLLEPLGLKALDGPVEIKPQMVMV